MYHCLRDIVLRLGMSTAMLRFLSPRRADAAMLLLLLLLSLQGHLVGINGFGVREGVKPLPPFRRRCTSPDYAGGFVTATGNVIASFATLKGLERVFVPAKRK